MVKITLISVGKIKEKYIKLGIEEFSKRLTKYCKLEIIEVVDEKAPENLSEKEISIVKDKEGEKIFSNIKQNSFIISLAIDGKKYSSMNFAKELDKITISGNSHIYFIIGGSLGLSDKILNTSNLKISFSDMTFPHQLMRLFLLEQIYRAFKINNGEPYHK
ncbi:23S rRNA (pseudouridine(1915)-N(3))-methyltransferase RlmH [Peptostreptococcus canis]|uniref:Ribosomal RNA large subunit methyltransferase H n=1 Tax=Peptostreptococcus canis TaxID=1159213 RepID=A0ABR6TN47_9FIRM|nr:23S rRNA (pseudouridine(1915)-N(3))-methyltransferase RlmH [Peptostreptococcus canis]MBC2576845.1 23S rRNA (pseudouridine(1915)-N(3))-methyltransferase RlmH [Peptostreptococcus canis]MBP1998934.1 23S rRNA (pseudouridine1915-N3)-methyltransferase [Peptostreptococcus canis]